MIFGPILQRELAIAPRRPRLYLYRCLYGVALLILISTAWLVLAGTQVVRCVGDMARFGSILFEVVALLQLALLTFFAAMSAAGAVSQEKDRRTLILLLVTDMTNRELVLGKLASSLTHVLVMVATSLPILMLCVLFGGISFSQVGRVFGVTLCTVCAAGALGNLLAFWREKTFQSLALTVMLICFWLGFWQVVASGGFGRHWLGIGCETWATGFSPLLAVLAAARPFLAQDPGLGALHNGVWFFLVSMPTLSLILLALTIARVRFWNPSREVRSRAQRKSEESIWGAQHDAQPSTETPPPRGSEKVIPAHEIASRPVWDNPVLWREMRTWAYGKKILVIRVAYLVLVAAACFAVQQGLPVDRMAIDEGETLVPAAAKPLAPLFVVSLVLVNALAVTSVTTERDGQALDLLLATDLSPHEFLFGKLGGVLWVSALMIVAPLGLSLAVWWQGGMSGEDVLLLVVGLLVMTLFVSMLGIHCGMRYANSRTAIGVSLGTVFFLFLGVVACMLMMVSFSSSFEVQMAPFLAFILGGGVGLFVALGAGNPSKAIAASSILAPFATFYAITSFLMDKNLSAFLVTTFTFGFTTAAMLIPALHEFDFAMGRSTTNDE